MHNARSRPGQSDAEAQAACERRLWWHLTWELEHLRTEGQEHLPFYARSIHALQRLEEHGAAPPARRGRPSLRVVRSS